MDRKCRVCGIVKSINEFANAGIIKGVVYYRWKCKPCYVEFKSDRRKRISAWFTDYKKSLKCEQCGIDDFRVLEFDHLRDKSFNLSDGARRGYGRQTILSEVKKCQCLCANCHRIKTYEERNNGV